MREGAFAPVGYAARDEPLINLASRDLKGSP